MPSSAASAFALKVNGGCSVTHFKAIDGARAYMAWWVVCQHMLQVTGMDRLHNNAATKLLTMGGLGVVVFVIISGFVITHLLEVKREPYGPYILRRFLRIYPLYILAVSLSLVLRSQYLDMFASVPWADESARTQVLQQDASMGWHVFLHMFLIHGIVPDVWLDSSTKAILAPAWSLSLEWQFYLVAPFMLAGVFSKKVWLQVISAIFVIIPMVIAYIGHTQGQWEYPAFLPLMSGFFLLGMATRLILGGESLGRFTIPLALIIANAAFYMEAYAFDKLALLAIPLVIWGFVCWICWRAREGAKVRMAELLLESRVVVNLGLWSYSTYLLHVPLFVITLSLLKWSGIPITQYTTLTALILSLPVLVVISWLSYEYVEKAGGAAAKRLLALPIKGKRSEVVKPV